MTRSAPDPGATPSPEWHTARIEAMQREITRLEVARAALPAGPAREGIRGQILLLRTEGRALLRQQRVSPTRPLTLRAQPPNTKEQA